jgi:hypothetical protein
MSTPTLLKYLNKLSDEVKNIIKKMLSAKFGLMFDCWSDETGGRYIGLFACFEISENKFPLLALSPLKDDTSFDVQTTSVSSLIP